MTASLTNGTHNYINFGGPLHVVWISSVSNRNTKGFPVTQLKPGLEKKNKKKSDLGVSTA